MIAFANLCVSFDPNERPSASDLYFYISEFETSSEIDLLSKFIQCKEEMQQFYNSRNLI